MDSVNSASNSINNKAWEQVPDKLVLYDYIGCNPSKGGLFRSGPIIKGDGIVQNWLGHPSFEIGTLSLVVYFTGGILNGTEYSTPSFVKGYARKAQFGEIFTFDKNTSGSDGVFRTSPRGWYSFSHIALALLF